MTSNEKVCRPALLRAFGGAAVSDPKEEVAAPVPHTAATSSRGRKDLALVMQKLLRETVPSLASGPLPGPEATLFELGVGA